MSRDLAVADMTGTIGNTPLVKIRKIGSEYGANIAVKLEYLNPTLSIKDRSAKAMVDAAEKQGILTPGKSVLVEGTSGNLGIALAHIGKIRGYKVILVMPATMSKERRAMLRAYGAEFVLSDPAKGHPEVIRLVSLLVGSIENAVCLDQFSNPANPGVHYQTTGPEIWRQTQEKVEIVVFGAGSGGTFSGVGKFLKEKNPNIRVYAVEPFESSVIIGFERGSHKIQGIGAGLIPTNFNRAIMEECIRVKSDDAIAMTHRLAQEEGILGGISSGANLLAALELAKRPENKGKLIVTSVNSFAERYFSTELYADMVQEVANLVKIETDDEAIQISKKYLAK